MTLALLFISPKTVVTIGSKIGGKAVDSIPVVGPTLKYVKKANRENFIEEIL